MKKMYLLLVIVFSVIFAFYVFHTFVKIQQYNYVTTVLDSNLKHSNILEEKLCKINKVRSADKDWFKRYDNDNDNNLYFKNFLIVCENNDTHIIKVIVKDDAFDIYAYEISGEVLYEETLNNETD